jgi:Pentapeptide repeats (8 copies)
MRWPLDRKLLEAEAGDSVYALAQARTSTMITRLDAEHIRSVTRFLTDSGLTGAGGSSISVLRRIDLTGADLSGALLVDADLSGAQLDDTNLSGADLSRADGVTNAELEQLAESLEGATMPNGQKYEDWLKRKGRGEDGENAGSS